MLDAFQVLVNDSCFSIGSSYPLLEPIIELIFAIGMVDYTLIMRKSVRYVIVKWETAIITSVTGNRNRTVLQRPRFLLCTDASDAIFLLADLQRCGFHDEGH